MVPVDHNNADPSPGFFLFSLYIYIDHLVRYMAEVCSPLERKSMAVSWAAHRSIPTATQSRWAVHAQRTAPNETTATNIVRNAHWICCVSYFHFEKRKEKCTFFHSVQEVCLINYRHRSGKGDAHGTWPWIFCLLLFFFTYVFKDQWRGQDTSKEEEIYSTQINKCLIYAVAH